MSVTKLDANQVLKRAFSELDNTIVTSNFITSKLGHKITRTIISATTDDYSYFDGATLLYTIRVIYSDGTHSDVNSVERTA